MIFDDLLTPDCYDVLMILNIYQVRAKKTNFTVIVLNILLHFIDMLELNAKGKPCRVCKGRIGKFMNYMYPHMIVNKIVRH